MVWYDSLTNELLMPFSLISDAVRIHTQYIWFWGSNEAAASLHIYVYFDGRYTNCLALNVENVYVIDDVLSNIYFLSVSQI